MLNPINIATFIGVLFAAISLRAAQRARFRSFEDLYVTRYWSLLDQMSPNCDPDVTADPVELSDEDRHVLWAYLRLSEDQLDMRKAGWVTDETWRLWASGIALMITREPMRSIWADASTRKGFVRMREFEAAGWDLEYDPNQMGVVRRWVRALAGISL